eukprot:6121031-Lingulodinium_polyedra.AAC.1
MSQGRQWIRVHVKSRNCMFEPVTVRGGPKVETLLQTRRTQMKLSKVTESKLVFHPNWCLQQRRIEVAEGMWTGRTIFTEGDDVPASQKTWGG